MSDHPTSIDEISTDDVDKLSSTGWQQLDGGKKEYLLGKAKRKVTGQWSKRQANTPTLQGDSVDATLLAAAHLFTLAQGGESQSDSTQGGSVNFNLGSTQDYEALSETRYGRELLSDYLRDRQGLGLVRTY